MKTIWSIIVAALLLSATFITGRVTKSCPAPLSKTDTVTYVERIRDTVFNDVIKYVVRVDSIPLVIPGDTLRDTVFIPIPIERKEYRTDRYFAIVEGFRADLVYMETYNKTTLITKTETFTTKPRWGIGVQVGVGYAFNGKIIPYVGIGVQYNIVTW